MEVAHTKHHHHHHHHGIDQHKLKKLRMRIEVDDPIHSGLKKLKLRGKDLGHLPNEIFHIDELEVLDLSPERESCLFYRLTGVPSGIGKLINLRVLMLDTNELEELPNEICLLSSLERLSISNNSLRTVPDAFASLRQLKSLHAANNKFPKVPYPICDLYDLEFLDMSDNALKSLPPEIGHLTKLQNLIVVFNQIKELPDSICDLKELRVLWLGYNQIKRLPRKFGRLRQLDWGYRHTASTVIDGNPMLYPPIEVCKRGVDAISLYFDNAENTRGHRVESNESNHRTPRRRTQESADTYDTTEQDENGDVYSDDDRSMSPEPVHNGYDRPKTHTIDKGHTDRRNQNGRQADKQKTTPRYQASSNDRYHSPERQNAGSKQNERYSSPDRQTARSKQGTNPQSRNDQRREEDTGRNAPLAVKASRVKSRRTADKPQNDKLY